MRDPGSRDESEADAGFSAFLQAIAAAPPPERAFAPGALVGPATRVARALFKASPGTTVYLGARDGGDVALLRREGVEDLDAHLRVLEAASKQSCPGRVEVLWAGRVAQDVVAVCHPVPAGTLRAWLAAGPHPWPSIRTRLGPPARALAVAHDAGLNGFSLCADDLWVGLDGVARLPPPEPGGSPAQDRHNLRELVRAALGPGHALPPLMDADRAGDANATRTLARLLAPRRRMRSAWLAVPIALVAAGLTVATRCDDRGSARPMLGPAPAPAPERSTADAWMQTSSRVDAGDRDAASLVDAFERAGEADPTVRAQAALLRVRLAEDAASWRSAADAAVMLAVQTQDPGVRFSVALVEAQDAFARGALLESRAHILRARRWAGDVPEAARRTLERMTWAAANADRDSPVRPREVQRASQQRSAPSLDLVELQRLLVDVWAAHGDRAVALEAIAELLAFPRAQLPRLRFEYDVCRAHLAMQQSRMAEASAALADAQQYTSTAAERASLALAYAALARVRGDRTAATSALTEAADQLASLRPEGLWLDLQFERAAWALHGADAEGALELLDAALARHDALRGSQARSRVPLEGAYRRTLQGETGLIREAPPSRASASP